MKYLVTGGAGFIGSHLIERLLSEHHSICCLDNFNNYYSPTIKWRNIENILQHSNFNLIEGDILDEELLGNIFQNHPFDGIIHLAARAGVRPSVLQPKLYEEVNVRGTMNLLEMAKQFQIKKFVMASSSSVYGNNSKVPFSETDPVDNPISPYAATKKAAELIGYTYSTLDKIAVTCLNQSGIRSGAIWAGKGREGNQRRERSGMGHLEDRSIIVCATDVGGAVESAVATPD